MINKSQLARIIQEKMLIHGAYKRLFGTPDGEVVLRHLMKKGFVMQSTFVAGDPHQTAMNEGCRRMVLSIIKFADISPEKVMQEIQESTEQ